ncbi:DUF1877 family protein [Veillonella sp.]|uniref:DUF1877 family protein n=1 Tax=Veillonella sp. TaxID=1926307 RepID=UPI0029028EE5|nr:DUF1877 family protein [Veillonella sp.]MDU1127700.1 DUF1877 family protein [Veillonella sp.]
MGLIANYSCLSDANLKELKAMSSEEEEILESVEEWNDDDELLLDIDKMWDVLHFVLTGVGTDHKDDKNPLSQAVLGVMAYEEEEEEIKDEIFHDFEQMKRFYKQVLEANGHVLVSIC